MKLPMAVYIQQLMADKQSINHYITYSIISSQPNLSYTSVVSTIRCFAVTSGEHEGVSRKRAIGNWSASADDHTEHICGVVRQLLQRCRCW